MANGFIKMIYGFLNGNGVDTKGMDVQTAINKYEEMNGGLSADEITDLHDAQDEIKAYKGESAPEKKAAEPEQKKYTFSDYMNLVSKAHEDPHKAAGEIAEAASQNNMDPQRALNNYMLETGQPLYYEDENYKVEVTKSEGAEIWKKKNGEWEHIASGTRAAGCDHIVDAINKRKKSTLENQANTTDVEQWEQDIEEKEDEDAYIPLNHVKDLKRYAERFDYTWNEIADSYNGKIKRMGMSPDEAVEMIKEQMASRKSLYD